MLGFYQLLHGLVQCPTADGNDLLGIFGTALETHEKRKKGEHGGGRKAGILIFLRPER
jgi:hypothetical protein